MNQPIDHYKSYYLSLQDSICENLFRLDPTVDMKEDVWDRPGGGGGITRVFSGNGLIEKGGVNFSHVFGEMPAVIKAESNGAEGFHAMGVSLVLHPVNPWVPIIHMNVRYFRMTPKAGDEEEVGYWFGGGIDVTPAYPIEDQAKGFHQRMKNACDAHHSDFYPKFKKWADEYFYLPHRKEMRGIGGIFFDHLNDSTGLGLNQEQLFQFVQEVGNSFNGAYNELVDANHSKPYTDAEKRWQYLRRGRYAEFNLIYDRGTHFGLKTNGRTESILMSLPPMAAWEYQHEPAAGSKEAAVYDMLQPKDWF